MKRRSRAPSEPITAVSGKVLEAESSGPADVRAENEELRAQLERERTAQLRLRGELDALIARSERTRDEFVHVEEQNAKLASLFVSSARLHEATDRAGVLDAIAEIVINLIGSEELAIFKTEPDGSLVLESSMGIDRARYEHVPRGRGIIGDVATTRSKFVRGVTPPRPIPVETEITACIPLALDGRTLGAVAIFRLLPQKAGLEAADHDLLDLLAVQASVALDYTDLRAGREKAGAA